MNGFEISMVLFTMAGFCFWMGWRPVETKEDKAKREAYGVRSRIYHRE